MTDDAFRERILRRLDAFMEESGARGPLNRLLEALPVGGGLYLVGGALRNLAMQEIHGSAPSVEDLDLFVTGVDERFNPGSVLGGEAWEFTDLGGVRWHPRRCGPAFDIGVMARFLPLRKFRLPPGLDSLLRTIDFNVNAAVFDVRERVLHQRNFVESIRRRVMDFNTRLFYDQVIMAYRVLEINTKIRFAYSRVLFDYVQRFIDEKVLGAVKPLLISKLGKDFAARVMEDYRTVCGYGSYDEYLKETPP